MYDAGKHAWLVWALTHRLLQPPSLVMLTASGRFSVNTKLCLSMTDFHPGTHLNKTQ